MSLSVVVITKNEQENIGECLQSIKFASEVIVVDDYSTDKTVNVAKGLGAKVLTRKLAGDFASQRNFGLKKAKNKWILFLDADERVSKELAEELMQTVNNSFVRAKGMYIKRVDHIWKKKLRYGETGNTKLLRLMVKGAGSWKRRVHEKLVVKGETMTLRFPIEHYPHPSVREFIASINQWSSMHAKANKHEGKSAFIIKIVFWPPAHFVKNYIFKLGFLDGIQGFMVALIMSFHSFLSWAKLWTHEKK